LPRRGNDAFVQTAYHLTVSWRNVWYECDTSQMNYKCLDVYGVVALTRLIYTGSLSGQYRFVTSCQFLSHRTWLTHWPTHDRAFSGSWSQQAPCTMHVYWTYREDGRSSKSALLPVIQHTFTILHMPIRRASVTKCRYFQRI